MNLASRLEAMWWRREAPPLALRWASRIYDLLNRRNLERRAARSIRPGVPLISVGNITVGGSGKTPFVIWLCGELSARGYRPVVLCRGDGGRLTQPRQILPGDVAEEVGDEALLLALHAGAPVVAGRDRVAGSRIAAGLGDVIVLDDGFQYRQLQRACDIVLLPAEGLGNGHLLPAGPLRETADALDRADLLVHSGGMPPAQEAGRKQWHWQAEVQPLKLLCGDPPAADASWLAVAGIARAGRFLEAAGRAVKVSQTRRFADHHRYSSTHVQRIVEARMPVLTTEKDAVKLLPLWPKRVPLAVLPLAGIGEQGLPEAIIQTMLRHPIP